MFVCPSAESGARRSPAQHFGRIMTERVGRLPWLWSRPFLATPPKNARGGRIGCRVPEQHDLDRSGDPLSTPGGHLAFRDRAQSPMANVRRAQCSAPSNKGLSRAGLAEDAGEVHRAEISTDPLIGFGKSPAEAACLGSRVRRRRTHCCGGRRDKRGCVSIAERMQESTKPQCDWPPR